VKTSLFQFVTERKEPVPSKWEQEQVLAENKNSAVREQLCKQLRLGVGSLGWYRLVVLVV
jgi:hypothetical protein